MLQYLPNLNCGVDQYNVFSRKTPLRYSQIIPIVRDIKPKIILEVGTHTGTRPAEWFVVHKDFTYYGVDLFELGNNNTLAKEGLVYKGGSNMMKTSKRLTDLGINHQLFKGFSKDTLLEFEKEYGRIVDFAYIDGGHSVETIQSDWDIVQRLVKKGGLVIFDDYYTNGQLDLNTIGCNKVVDPIQGKHFLPQTDTVRGSLGWTTIHLVSLNV